MSDKPLKKGFTTGASAAAATKAALYFLLGKEKKSKVKIRFLTGEQRFIDIFDIRQLTDNQVQCLVVKDAGDDPDITHKAQIGVKITLLKTKGHDITIKGGVGVGKVTKPGLELTVGEFAINPGPRAMIRESIDYVFDNLSITRSNNLVIEVFVPRGEELAKKTLNARLGIIGGISILGTTGIVTPMSHDAYIATIKAGVNIAAAKGGTTLVYTTGRRSERFAMDLFPDFFEECFVQTGDFFKASIDQAVKNSKIQNLIITVFFGKAVKMAMGFEHTHAAKSNLSMEKLAGWAKTITSDPTLVRKIKSANTARHAFSFIYPKFPDLVSHVGKKIVANGENFAENKLSVRSIIFDFDGNLIFDSLAP